MFAAPTPHIPSPRGNVLPTMNLLVIPTFNRSFKLARVLDFYASYERDFKIVVLDGSDDAHHQAVNQSAVDRHRAFAERISLPQERNVIERLLKFMESIDEDVLAIGNDEDVFFPQFLKLAFAHLRANPDYAAATGKYVTTARPLFGFRRISFWSDTFVGIDIDQDDPALRMICFQRFNSAGVPPIFWSVRRKDVFAASLRHGMRLQYAGAQELIDQINTCVMGKLLISDQPMLLRDESRLKYVPEKNRDEGKHYIGGADLAQINAIAAECWNSEVGTAVKAVTGWFAPNASGESCESRLNARVYCRFNPVSSARGDRILGGLQRCIKWSCIIGNLLSQVFAYAYFLRYMGLQRKGRLFMRMTKAVAVNK
jgi:glycosyltransferase domain-containing protein